MFTIFAVECVWTWACIWVNVCVDHACELPSVCVFGCVCAQPRVEENKIHQHVSAVGVFKTQGCLIEDVFSAYVFSTSTLLNASKSIGAENESKLLTDS